MTVHRNRRAAFTLVELLVVVSIIALLISMLLPAMKRARGQAKQVVCASQLRQMAGAIWSYWTDHNGRIPYVISPFTNGEAAAPDGGRVPGFGDEDVEDDRIDPFNPNEQARDGRPKGWPMSLPNVLGPSYLGSQEKVYACPAAQVGWPRHGDRFRMTYRPAAANQISGIPPSIPDGEFSYFREHFGFLDGRIYKPPEPVHRSGDDRLSIVRDAQRMAALRGTFLRDMIKKVGYEIQGPHLGGNNIITKRLEVEYRDKVKINEDLALAGPDAVRF